MSDLPERLRAHQLKLANRETRTIGWLIDHGALLREAAEALDVQGARLQRAETALDEQRSRVRLAYGFLSARKPWNHNVWAAAEILEQVVLPAQAEPALPAPASSGPVPGEQP